MDLRSRATAMQDLLILTSPNLKELHEIYTLFHYSIEKESSEKSLTRKLYFIIPGMDFDKLSILEKRLSKILREKTSWLGK